MRTQQAFLGIVKLREAAVSLHGIVEILWQF